MKINIMRSSFSNIFLVIPCFKDDPMQPLIQSSVIPVGLKRCVKYLSYQLLFISYGSMKSTV